MSSLPLSSRWFLVAQVAFVHAAAAQSTDADSMSRAGSVAGRQAAESLSVRKWGVLGFVGGVLFFPLLVAATNQDAKLPMVAAVPAGLITLQSQRARVAAPPPDASGLARAPEYQASFERAYAARVKERRMRATTKGAGMGAGLVLVALGGFLMWACASSPCS